MDSSSEYERILREILVSKIESHSPPNSCKPSLRNKSLTELFVESMVIPRKLSTAAEEITNLEIKLMEMIHTGDTKRLKPNSGEAVMIGNHSVSVDYAKSPESDDMTWYWSGSVYLYDNDGNMYKEEYFCGSHVTEALENTSEPEAVVEKGNIIAKDKQPVLEEDEDEDEKDDDQKLSRSEYLVRKEMKRLKYMSLDGVHKVTFRTTDNVMLFMSKPKVFKDPNSETCYFFGEIKNEDTLTQHENQAAQQFGTDMGSDLENLASAYLDERKLDVNETELDPDDIKLVMKLAGVSRERAAIALQNCNEDVVRAIMEIKGKSVPLF